MTFSSPQAFRASRMSQAPPLNNLHTSFLAYSLGGELAKPDAVENDTRMSNIRSVIETKVNITKEKVVPLKRNRFKITQNK